MFFLGLVVFSHNIFLSCVISTTYVDDGGILSSADKISMNVGRESGDCAMQHVIKAANEEGHQSGISGRTPLFNTATAH